MQLQENNTKLAIGILKKLAARGPIIFVQLLGVVRTDLLQQLFKSSGRTFVQLTEGCLLHKRMLHADVRPLPYFARSLRHPADWPGESGEISETS